MTKCHNKQSHKNKDKITWKTKTFMVALIYSPGSLGEAKTRGSVQEGELEFL